MNTLGERIKKARINKGYNQKDLAEKLHVKNTTVSMWEMNNSKPDVDTLICLANLLEVDLDFLIQCNNRPTLKEELEKWGISEDDILKLPEERKRLLYKIIDDVVNHVN